MAQPGTEMNGITLLAWARAARHAGVTAGALGILAACGASQAPPPQVLSGDESQVTIAAGLDNSPRPLAEAHCEVYGRRAVVRDAVPVSDNVVRGWATGQKGFIYTFDCI
jgi:hypothetical protein